MAQHLTEMTFIAGLSDAIRMTDEIVSLSKDPAFLARLAEIIDSDELFDFVADEVDGKFRITVKRSAATESLIAEFS